MPNKSIAAKKIVKGIRARQPEEKQNVREQLLRNAIDLYRETGFQGFSMRKLAARAGFSPSALYRYFSNREEVFSSLVDMGFLLMEQTLSGAKGKDLQEFLLAYAKAYLSFAIAEPELYKLMTSDHPPSTVYFGETTTSRRWSIFSGFGKQTAAYGLPPLKNTQESIAVTDALWAFGHGLASLVISLPYFDQERMDKALDFAVNQFGALLSD